MDVNCAILRRRTIRRFTQQPVSRDQLRELVNLSRLYASGGNLQPIRYVGVLDAEKREAVFHTLRWAAYLPGFEITPNQRPTAYVIHTSNVDSKRNCQFDLGAAATTLMLAAEAQGLSTCCLGSFERQKLTQILELSDTEPLLVIAVGYPAQESKVVDMTYDVKYYENEEGCLCVPKRTLDELLTMF